MPEHDIEKRFLTDSVTADTTEDGAPRITGMGIVFDQRSEVLVNNMGAFVEEIDQSAFDDVMPFADVRGRYDHDIVLGRTKNGTLILKKEARGISYEIRINPNDQEAMSAYEKVKRGDVDGSSFMFIVAKGGDTWRRDNGVPVRRVMKVSSLLDIGPVPYPAYPQTTSGVRSQLEALQQQEPVAPNQAASSGAEDQVKVRRAAAGRQRVLDLLGVRNKK